MGEIVGAAIVSHVPPIVMGEADLADLYGPAGTTLLDGLHRLRRERFDALDVDTVVVFDTHWFTTVEHIITSHARRSGVYTSEELPRGMRQMPYDLRGDPELADCLRRSRRRPRRHTGARLRRPLPSDPLPHHQPAAVPATRRGVGEHEHLPDRHPCRLAARRRTARPGHRRTRPPGGAARVRGPVAPLLADARVRPARDGRSRAHSHSRGTGCRRTSAAVAGGRRSRHGHRRMARISGVQPGGLLRPLPVDGGRTRRAQLHGARARSSRHTSRRPAPGRCTCGSTSPSRDRSPCDRNAPCDSPT